MKQIITVIAVAFFNIGVYGKTISITNEINVLEKGFEGKIGIYALDTNNNNIIAYRENELFPIQSTMKMMVVATLLKKSEIHQQLLRTVIHYNKKDLIPWHPVTGKYINTGMALEALGEASMTYSDNTAVNVIMKHLGGPKAIIEFARSIGNKSYNVSHYDGFLNSDPNNNDDSATPKDMAISVKKLIVGNHLAQSQKNMLLTWMHNNTTSYRRMRYGAPSGWDVADKTGSGNFGITNDIGILWSPTCKPIVLSIYTVRNRKELLQQEDVVAQVTKFVIKSLSKYNNCELRY